MYLSISTGQKTEVQKTDRDNGDRLGEVCVSEAEAGGYRQKEETRQSITS